MSNPDTAVRTKDFSDPAKLTMDKFVRQLVAECFENDNDTSTLECTLTDVQGTESILEFEIKILSINGIPTRS